MQGPNATKPDPKVAAAVSDPASASFDPASPHYSAQLYQKTVNQKLAAQQKRLQQAATGLTGVQNGAPNGNGVPSGHSAVFGTTFVEPSADEAAAVRAAASAAVRESADQERKAAAAARKAAAGTSRKMLRSPFSRGGGDTRIM